MLLGSFDEFFFITNYPSLSSDYYSFLSPINSYCNVIILPKVPDLREVPV